MATEKYMRELGEGRLDISFFCGRGGIIYEPASPACRTEHKSTVDRGSLFPIPSSIAHALEKERVHLIHKIHKRTPSPEPLPSPPSKYTPAQY